MRPYQAVCIVVAALMLLEPSTIEAKRRKHKGDDRHDSNRSKTKTKWSSSTELGGANTHVSTEEHGYYVKRTYSPLKGDEGKRMSPPYLAIPIAWFGCESGKTGCQQASNSGAINSPALALSEGYLCDDDCMDAYEPICGQTPNEVAVFYNKCKLNVAKCRTHGLWRDLPYEQCQKTYPKETAYTEKKFKCSPYFRDNATIVTPAAVADTEKDKESMESSEEQNDQDKKKNGHKMEKMEPIALPLQKLPTDSSVPVPNESIALPPMPVKITESQPKPQLDEKTTQIQAQPVKGSQAPKPLETVIASAMDQAERIIAATETTKEQIKPKADKDKLKYVVA